MRGNDDQLQRGMFSCVPLEDRIAEAHPLRGVRKLADAVLAEMSQDFDGMYATAGRPSIPPERLFRALLLQVFYSVRSERLLMEQLDYNRLFRWFVGLEIDEPVWNHAVFRKNRGRLLNQEVAQQFFAQVKAKAVSQSQLKVESGSADFSGGSDNFGRFSPASGIRKPEKSGQALLTFGQRLSD